MALLQWVFWICELSLLYLIWGRLRVIARETEATEDLRYSIEKFAALAGGAKEKVVAFRAKKKDDDADV
jgi:hypothetical protein